MLAFCAYNANRISLWEVAKEGMLDTKRYQFESEYADIADEKLIEIIKCGDKKALDYLLNKYADVVAMKANRFFIIGAERDDMIQEGFWGLYKAIQSFDPEKQNSFRTFANLCIERQLITTIKTSNRQKNIPLNSSFSLNVSAYDENDDISVLDILDTKTVEDPLETIIKKEYYTTVENKIDQNLSKFEKDVLNKYIQGQSYVTIANSLEAPVKSVDNAIQRIRKKAIKCLEEGE